MPESPDFEAIARRLAGVWADRGAVDGMTESVVEQLRLVWNARGASDIAKLEFEIPNVWTTPEPAGALTRALRSLDR